MIFKPFRPPLLKKPAPVERIAVTPPPEDGQPAAKKRRLSAEPDEENDDALDNFLDEAEGLTSTRPSSAASVSRAPRPKLSSSAFRKAHASSKPVPQETASLEHEPLVTSSQSLLKTGPAARAAGPEAYYNALWRKVTNKKNKTWDGDGILAVRDGFARLQDLAGRDMGRTRCEALPAVGATLTMSGKEVEVDSEIPKAEYLAGKIHLSAGAGKPTIKELEAQMRTDVRFNAPDAAQQHHTIITTPNAASASAVQHKPTNNAFKMPLLDNSSGLGPAPRPEPQKVVPRHDPDKDGALVMKRIKYAPKGKQIVDVVVDPIISTHFREHQREGVKFMYECIMGLRSTGEGCILADEMGLGKTLQVIALIWTLLKQNPVYGDNPVVKKALIVCPATLIKNWRKEFRKWLGNERLGVFVVEEKARIRDFTHGRAYNVCIIGYERLVKEQEKFQHGCGIDIVIADEGHRLKTATNKAAQAIKSLGTEKRIVLSGTPLQNNLSEFYFTTDLVNPGILGKPGVFKKQFEMPIVRGRQQDASVKDIELGTARYKELADLTSQFLLRRTADILAQYLPPKTEYILFCKPTRVQASIYRSILSSPSFSAVFKASETSLQLINILKKLCNSPNLLRTREDGESKNATIASIISSLPAHYLNAVPSGKLQVLDQLLHTIRYDTNEKVVIVSHYTATLDIIGNMLNSLNYPWLRLDGNTPQAKRQGLVDKFNRTPQDTCFAFLLSAKSGGAGLNLIGASRLILFDIDWNPSTDAQAMARIHRDGQRNPCRIYRLLIRGALDEKIYQRQLTKQGLADSVVDSKKDGGSTFSREELQQLFKLDEAEHCQTHELLGCECMGKGTLPADPAAEDVVLTAATTAATSLATSPAASSSSSSSSSVSLGVSDAEQSESESVHEERKYAQDEDDTLPTFTSSSQIERDPSAREAALHRALASKKRKRTATTRGEDGGKFASLMQYRHIDIAALKGAAVDDGVSAAAGNTGDGIAAVIDDAVLVKVIQGADNPIRYVFSKTAGGLLVAEEEDDDE